VETKRKLVRIAILVPLVLAAVSTLYPLLFMFQNSFKGKFEYYAAPFALPKSLRFENYRLLLNQFNAMRFFANSMIVSLSSLFIALALSIPSGFVFAKLRFRGKRAIYIAVLALMMVPGQVMIVPTYVMYSKLGLMNSFYSVILAYAVGSIPFSVYMLTSGFKGIPNELIEAGKIDGASFMKSLVSIAVPLTKAAIVTVVIFNFIGYWNELIVAMLYLQRDDMKTLTAAVATILRQRNSDYPFFYTGLLINCLPPIVLYLVFQKEIASGITVGAIK
jgi:ABC-type glycerol-3-phosphate transport system permease component